MQVAKDIGPIRFRHLILTVTIIESVKPVLAQIELLLCISMQSHGSCCYSVVFQILVDYQQENETDAELSDV